MWIRFYIFKQISAFWTRNRICSYFAFIVNKIIQSFLKYLRVFILSVAKLNVHLEWFFCLKDIWKQLQMNLESWFLQFLEFGADFNVKVFFVATHNYWYLQFVKLEFYGGSYVFL